MVILKLMFRIYAPFVRRKFKCLGTKNQVLLIAFNEGERILIMSFFFKSVPWVLQGGPTCIDVIPFNFRVCTPSWVDGLAMWHR